MKRNEKYLKALISIKKTIDENPRVSMTKLGREYKLTPNWYTIPIEWGVLEKRGNARLVRWYWKGSEPNEKMVRDLLKQMRKGNAKNQDWEGVHTKMLEFAKSLGYDNVAEAIGAMGNYNFKNQFRNGTKTKIRRRL